MTSRERECKALSGPKGPKRTIEPQTPRPDAAIRNFFVAVGKLGKEAAPKTDARSARGKGEKR